MCMPHIEATNLHTEVQSSLIKYNITVSRKYWYYSELIIMNREHYPSSPIGSIAHYTILVRMQIYFSLLYYRPHPKDGGRYCFQFVCQFTPRPGGGGVPDPALEGGYPVSGWGVPVSGLGGGTPSQIWGGYL